MIGCNQHFYNLTIKLSARIGPSGDTIATLSVYFFCFVKALYFYTFNLSSCYANSRRCIKYSPTICNYIGPAFNNANLHPIFVMTFSTVMTANFDRLHFRLSLTPKSCDGQLTCLFHNAFIIWFGRTQDTNFLL